MRPIIITLHQLGHGGVTNAVLDQAQMFSEAGYPTTIATMDDSPASSTRVEELRGSGRLPAEVEVRNVHRDARDAASVGGAAPALRRLTGAAQRLAPHLRGLSHRSRHLLGRSPAADLVETGTDRHGSYRRHFAPDGEYRSFDRLEDDGSVRHTNVFENRVLVRRDEYAEGSVSRRTWFTPEGKTNRVQFLTPDGFCYLQRWIDPDNGRGVGVYAADRGSGVVTRYNGLPDWHVSWLQELVDESPVAPYVIAETASTISKTIRLRRDSAVRMAMMHNSHVAAPFRLDSPTRPDYAAIFDRLGSIDAYAILSERQRSDMVDRLGSPEVFTVVPNALRIPDRPQVERDPHLVSVVARLAPQKALHEAIEAFAAVVQEVPEARLEIYGRGAERERLEALAAERGLADSVIFRGRTSTPEEVMARSVCTISTSDWEALPLTIAESLLVGTPVVAYDCLYGPSTLIRDGVTGRVTGFGDRAELAAAIIDLLRHPATVERWGEAGRRDIVERLSFPQVLTAWQDAFAYAERRAGLTGA